MSTRAELFAIATQWVSLWTGPVDWALFDRLHADSFEDRSSADRPSTKEGFAGGLEEFVRAFPDVKTKIEDLVAEESTSKVAIRWSARGTNRTHYLGIGPTHRLTTITGIEIIEVRAGQIVRRWGEWDISDHREMRR
jgi:steroid delta-isomerase-like uncharacterized protein